MILFIIQPKKIAILLVLGLTILVDETRDRRLMSNHN